MKTLFTLFFSLLFWTACGDDERLFKQLPDGPVKHQYIVMAKTKDGVRARGFKGAVPAQTSVFFEVGRTHSEMKANDDGSFDIELRVNQVPERGDLTFTIAGTHNPPVTYTIKKLSDSLSWVAKNTIKTGFEIDYVAVEKNRVAILSSSAALLNVYNLKSTWEFSPTSNTTTFLNPHARANLVPRMFSWLNDKALVSFFGTHEIGLFDTTARKQLSLSRLHDKNGRLYLFDNNPALTVAEALSADGSAASTRITRSFAHNAEAVHHLDDERFLASFVNYYQAENPEKHTSTVVGPGIVALMKKENDTVKTLAIVTLPFKNPQHFIERSPTEVWVNCSGAFSDIGTPNLRTEGAGLIKLNLGANTLTIAQQIALPNFPPARPALVGDTLIVPRAWGNEIAVFDKTHTKLSPDTIKKHSFHRPFSFTFAEHWHDDIAFLTTLDGFIVAYSAKEGFFPFPFTEPMVLTPKKDDMMVVQPTQLLVRNLEKYEPGYNLWAISAGHYIMPLDLMEIFGP